MLALRDFESVAWVRRADIEAWCLVCTWWRHTDLGRHKFQSKLIVFDNGDVVPDSQKDVPQR